MPTPLRHPRLLVALAALLVLLVAGAGRAEACDTTGFPNTLPAPTASNATDHSFDISGTATVIFSNGCTWRLRSEINLGGVWTAVADSFTTTGTGTWTLTVGPSRATGLPPATTYSIRLLATRLDDGATWGGPGAPASTRSGPTVVAPPVLSGTARGGGTLATSDGSWDDHGEPGATEARAWERCDADGSGCATVPGASLATYELGPDDVGHRLRALVRRRNPAATSGWSASSTSPIVAPGATAPPTVIGLREAGSTLEALSPDESWGGATGLERHYEWERCNADAQGCVLLGVDVTRIDLAETDIGRSFRVRVHASKAGAETVSAWSDSAGPIRPQPPFPVEAPTIVGLARDLETFTSTAGRYGGTNVAATLRAWQACNPDLTVCEDLAYGVSYTIDNRRDDLIGRRLRLRVRVEGDGGGAWYASEATATIVAAAPVVLGPPAVAGVVVHDPASGRTLTGTPGVWRGSYFLEGQTVPPALAYQWLRCDAGGDGCVEIGGAIAATYILAAVDVGHALRLRVTGANGVGAAVVATSPATTSVQATPPGPLGRPVVSGDAVDGGLLTATPGTWSGTEAAYAFRWRRCDATGAGCADIADATGSTYRLTGADAGRRVKVRVAATNAAGSAVQDSDPTDTVASLPPAVDRLPAITGDPRDGVVLTADPGDWHGSPPLAFAYRWLRCIAGTCAPIPGADAATYAPTAADVHATLRVRVTATNGAPGPVDALSPETAEVLPAPPRNAVAPSIVGVAREDTIVSADGGRWDGTAPIALSYRWQRCDLDGCADLDGATGPLYALGAADVHHGLRVLVTATNEVPGPVTAVSPTVPVLAAPPVGIGRPVVSGELRDGETLTTTNGAWSGTGPLAFAQRWQRCDADGSGCTDLPGATGPTYVLGAADTDHRLRAIVTAASDGNDPVAQASLPTGAVGQAPPRNVTAPGAPGAAVDGEELVADPGSWLGTPVLDLAYAWLRCDASGAACGPIAGAVHPTYALTHADVGHRLALRVTASNRAGSAAATGSAGPVVAPSLPHVVAAPQIAGDPADGALLAADVGAWSGTPPLTHALRWQRCDAAGGACADLPGETGASYRTVSADVGRRIRVLVVATNAAGTSTWAASAPTDPIAATAPIALTPPVLAAADGLTDVGDVVRVVGVSWGGTAPLALAVRWQLCAGTAPSSCDDVPNAVRDDVEIRAEWLGQRLRALVTATNVAGTATVATTTSDVLLIVPPSVDLPPGVAAPAVLEPGAELQAVAGRFAGSDPIAVSYAWLRCDAGGSACSAIAGAVGPAYIVGDEDVGLRLAVRATARNRSDAAANVTSAPTGLVAPRPPAVLTPPSIAGDVRVGGILAAGGGSFVGTPPLRLERSWLRCAADGDGCSPIDGAGSASYRAVAADGGHRLRVEVRATGRDGRSAVGRSEATAVLGEVAPPAVARAPRITGVAREGELLTADPGGWTGTDVALALHWQRCAAGGTACTDLPGAAGPTYRLAAADVGRRLRLRVEGSNAAVDAPIEAVSDPTQPVTGLGPVSIVPPASAGAPVPGAAVTCSAGSFEPAPSRIGYSWVRLRGVVEETIDGEGEPTYVLDEADRGAAISCRLVVVGPTGGTSVVDSDPIGPVVSPADVTEDDPRPWASAVDGGTAVGEQARCTRGAWIDAGWTSTVTWLVDGRPVADGPAYVPVAADQGRRLSCRLAVATPEGRAVETTPATAPIAAATDRPAPPAPPSPQPPLATPPAPGAPAAPATPALPRPRRAVRLTARIAGPRTIARGGSVVVTGRLTGAPHRARVTVEVHPAAGPVLRRAVAVAASGRFRLRLPLRAGGPVLVRFAGSAALRPALARAGVIRIRPAVGRHARPHPTG